MTDWNRYIWLQNYALSTAEIFGLCLNSKSKKQVRRNLRIFTIWYKTKLRLTYLLPSSVIAIGNHFFFISKHFLMLNSAERIETKTFVFLLVIVESKFQGCSMTDTSPSYFILRQVWLSCPNWPQTFHLLVSASQVTGNKAFFNKVNYFFFHFLITSCFVFHNNVQFKDK